jgi:Nicastrin small lobe
MHDSSGRKACSLVLAGPVPEEGLSDAAVFPGAAYAPYPNSSYAWNPRGSGVDRARIDVPVTLLSGGAAADAQRRASGNAIQVRQ